MNELPHPYGSRIDSRRCLAVIIGLGGAMTLVLSMMGRVWWCELGDYSPWSWDVWSSHNSQHLVDPYALSHIQHGIGLFLILTLFGHTAMSMPLRSILVAMVEVTWEIAENTPWIVNRYREATVSLDYYGDSIVNSVGDYAACLFGILIAIRLHPGWAIAIFVAFEILSIIWIRDSLGLNILMLLYPLDAVREWQAA